MQVRVFCVLAAAAVELAGCLQRKDDDVLIEIEPVAVAATAARAPTAPSYPAVEINPRLLRRFQPLPATLPLPSGPTSQAEIDLGRSLYYDKRLSKDGDLSCNGCHDLADYGVDHQRLSPGSRGQRGTRNTPTVYNAAGFFAQFWDGRSPNVEDQAKAPVLNPVEMAMPDRAHVVATLKGVPGYMTAFHRAFPEQADPVTFDNMGRAIGAFERGLLTPGRWDDFLRGKSDALTSEEKLGLKTFLDAGCMVCHTGPYLGGSMFERAGAVEPWPNQQDRGRQEVTKAAEDGMMFKVPTLRNIAQTAPYFHDGSAATLPEAVKTMGRYQLGLDFSNDEVAAIVTWLGSLTGRLPSAYIAAVPAATGEPQLADGATAAAATMCGHSRAPDCPLQAWMKGNMAHQALDGDAMALERGFTTLASLEIPGFPDWGAMARSGVAASHDGDLPRAKRACTQCHEAYRARYRAERRATPFR